MVVNRLIWRFVPSWGFSSLSAPNILKNGDIIKQARVFANEDVIKYSEMSYDSNPLYFNSESAKNAGFKDIVVPGMLVASSFPRIIASHFPGAVYVSQTLHFRLPVYMGEEIISEVQATSIREMKTNHIAKFSTKCFQNGGRLVLDGEAIAILPTLAIERV